MDIQSFKSSDQTKLKAVNQLINTIVISESDIEKYCNSIINVMAKGLLAFEDKEQIQRVIFFCLKQRFWI